MCEIYAAERGWSMTKRRRANRMFAFEFSMSRLGKKDSKNPTEEILVAYAGGHAVEYRRKGQWTATMVINKYGKAVHGQWQGETGISDLLILQDLYNKVFAKMEVTA